MPPASEHEPGTRIAGSWPDDDSAALTAIGSGNAGTGLTEGLGDGLGSGDTADGLTEGEEPGLGPEPEGFDEHDASINDSTTTPPIAVRLMIPPSDT